MNSDLIVQILQLAASVIRGQTDVAVQHDANVAQTLVHIVQAAARAYENQTGQPIDPSLIKPEAPL
jgi:hypothetical protein